MGKFLLVVVVFGAAVYAVFWLIERRRAPVSPGRLHQPRAPRRVVAPDDDEDFLRELERRRRAARNKQQGPPDPSDPKRPSDS